MVATETVPEEYEAVGLQLSFDVGHDRIYRGEIMHGPIAEYPVEGGVGKIRVPSVTCRDVVAVFLSEVDVRFRRIMIQYMIDTFLVENGCINVLNINGRAIHKCGEHDRICA